MDGDASEDDEDDVESVLADIKAHPGNVSLNSPLDEISKLGQVRAVGVPEKAFTGIGVQVITAWRAQSLGRLPEPSAALRCPCTARAAGRAALPAAAGDH